MAATSHYQSTNSTPPLLSSALYRRHPGYSAAQPDHLYSSGLAAWPAQTPEHLSFPPDQSSTLHRDPDSSGPRQLPAATIYNHSPPNVDCNTINPAPAQSQWPVNDARSVWDNALPADAYSARPSVPYGEAALTAAPHPNSASHLGQPDPMYRTMVSNQPLPLPSAYTSTPTASQFPSTAPRAAPVAHILNYPAQALPWPAGPNSDVSPASQVGGLLSHTSIALSSGSVATSIANSTSPWSIVDGATNSITPPSFNRITDVETDWTLLGNPNETESHPLLSHQDQFSIRRNQQAPATFVPRSGQGHTSVSKPKLPKIAASFHKRQAKNKISKRGQGGDGPKKFSQEDREKIKLMREQKQCIRCKMYKIGCDPGIPCQKCTKMAENARAFVQPCFREHLDSATLVRHCNGRLNQAEVFFLTYSWKEESVLQPMEIIWNLPGFGHLQNCLPFRLWFREYSPDDQLANLDPTAQYWQNTAGEVNRISQPPYAVFEPDSLIEDVERYFLANQPAIESWILHRVKDDELSLRTYHEVLRYRVRSPMLDTALKLQCLSIVSQGYGSVWSQNIPGIKEYDYPKLGRSGYEAYDRPGRDKPLPAAIAHQMDVAILKSLKKLEKKCAKQLMAKVFQGKLLPWYELFLTFFVLLWNLEYIHSGAESYIMSKSGTMLQDRVSHVVRSQISQWEHAVRILFYHWKSVLRGFVPFRIARENPQEFQEKRDLLDPVGLNYVIAAAHTIANNGPERYSGPSTQHAPIRNTAAREWIATLFKEAGG